MKKYVDFHMHSIVSRSINDSIDWHSIEDTLNTLSRNKVKYFSFTDHDFFKLSFYFDVIETIKKLKLDLVFFPGIEITILRKNGLKGHIIFLFENNISKDKLYLLQSLINENKNDSGVNLKIFLGKLKEFKFYIIPHIGKSDSVAFDDISFCIDEIDYVESKPNKKEYSIFRKQSDREIKCLMFSDCHEWNKYNRPDVYVEDKNFNSLKDILDNLRIE